MSDEEKLIYNSSYLYLVIVMNISLISHSKRVRIEDLIPIFCYMGEQKVLLLMQTETWTIMRARGLPLA